MGSARSAGLHEERGAGAAARPLRHPWLRWLPLGVVALALAALYAAGLEDYLSIEAFRRYQDILLADVAREPLLASAAYCAVYVAVVAISFPGAGILTVIGGFLFGPWIGTVLASVASTVGATLIFLVARTSLGAFIAEWAGPRIRRLRERIQADGFSYLLFLRLVPIFPFWLVNLAAALFGMRLLPYVAATAIGVVPATFVFAYFGHGLATALDDDGAHVPKALLLALALLGLLALAPVIVRRLRRGREEEQGVPPQSRA